MKWLLLLPLMLDTALAQDSTPNSAVSNPYAFRLFQLFRQETKGNFGFSPYSSHAVAAMLADGAGGQTLNELLAMTQLPAGEAARTAATKTLSDQLRGAADGGALSLGIANSIWAPQTLPFAPAFVIQMKGIHRAHAGALPANNPVQAAVAVNSWVRQNTGGKITNLVGPANFPADRPFVVLVNAVYLKSRWAEPFDPRSTKPRPFHLAGDRATMLPTMTQKSERLYAENESWQCLELPFISNAVVFHVLLPRDEAALKKVETGLSPETWAAVTGSLAPADVTTFLPRFSYSTRLSLTPMWQALGVKTAFTDTADFKRMIPASPCLVSEVIHEAVIDVNELGAEATAATMAAAGPFGAAPPTKKRQAVFRADRSFLWVISHRRTGCILFMGRFAGE